MPTTLNKNLRRLLVCFCFISVSYKSFSQIKSCSDTSERKEFYLRSDYHIEKLDLLHSKKSQNFHCASVFDTTLKLSKLVLALFDNETAIEWQKEIIPQNGLPQNIVYKAFECTNGDFVLIMNSFDPNQTILNTISLIRVSATGTIVSSFKLNRNWSAPGNSINSSPTIKELENGDLAVALAFPGQSTVDAGTTILAFRMDQNGMIHWSKIWELNTLLYLTGLESTNQSLILSFNSDIQRGFGYNSFGLIKLKLGDGQQIDSRIYRYPQADIDNLLAFGPLPAETVKMNENRLLGVFHSSYREMIRVEFDSNLNLITKLALRCTNPRIGFGDIKIDKQGSICGASISFEGKDAEENLVFVMDSAKQFATQRTIYFNTGKNPLLSESANLFLDSTNRLSFHFLFRNLEHNKWQRIRFNVKNNDTTCIGKQTSVLKVENLSLESFAYPINQSVLPNISLSPISVRESNILIGKTDLCTSIVTKSLDLGQSLSSCQNDTLQIKATAGFDSYKWFGPYIIGSVSDSFVYAKPEESSSYIVTVKTATGCTLQDTVSLTVLKAPKIDLGKDTSLCKGQQIDFDAGRGFISYAWNTGETSQKIIAEKQGSYAVRAFFNNGCYSSDTVRVQTVFELPVVGLNQRSILCINQSDSIFPKSSFSEYQWSTGASQRAIKVVVPGKYWLRVKDSNGCYNSDTTTIISLVQTPKGFAPPDTSVCQYENLGVGVNGNYKSYLWDNGSSQPTNSYSKAGTFWVQVVDSNGCNSKEFFKVSHLNCPNRIYLPNAFTPDANGRNDRFVALVKGNLQSYRLTVFNRWGQRVFFTTNPSFAWDGKFNGNKVGTGTFVWLCEFQFSGEEKKVIKGTVVLIQ